MKIIKIKLTDRITSAELLESRKKTVKVRLPDGTTIVRKRCHIVEPMEIGDTTFSGGAV